MIRNDMIKTQSIDAMTIQDKNEVGCMWDDEQTSK